MPRGCLSLPLTPSPPGAVTSSSYLHLRGEIAEDGARLVQKLRLPHPLLLRQQDQVAPPNPTPASPHTLTLSSPAATLNASSTRQPTAMRTALEECISFHTVSLSTCRGRRVGFSVPPAGGGQEGGATVVGGREGLELGAPPAQPHGRVPYSPQCPHKAAWRTSSG